MGGLFFSTRLPGSYYTVLSKNESQGRAEIKTETTRLESVIDFFSYIWEEAGVPIALLTIFAVVGIVLSVLGFSQDSDSFKAIGDGVLGASVGTLSVMLGFYILEEKGIF